MSALDEQERQQTEEPEHHLGYSYMGQEEEGAGGLPFHLENEEGMGSEVGDEEGEAEIDEDGLLSDWAIRSLSACEGLPPKPEEVNWNDKEQVSRIWNCVLVLREVGRGIRRLSARRSSLGSLSTTTASTTKFHSAPSARAAHSPLSLSRPSRALVGTSGPSVSKTLPRLLEALRVEEVELDTGTPPGAARGAKSEERSAPVAAMETEIPGAGQRVLAIVYEEIIQRYKELYDGLEPEAEYACTGCESLAYAVPRILGVNDALDEATDESVGARARSYIGAHIVGTLDGKLAFQSENEQLPLDDIAPFGLC